MKITNKDVALVLILFLIIPYSAHRLSSKEIDKEQVALIKKYVTKLETNGKNSIVILHNSGRVDREGNPIEFIDKVVIEAASNILAQNNYTLIYMSLPCIGDLECYNKYFEIGKLVIDLKPKAIIFNSPSSGLNTDTLGALFDQADIPLYVYQTESNLNYKQYTGPNNVKIGETVALGLKPKIKPKDKIVYVETVRLINGDTFDNGFPRINAARNLLTSYGAIEYKTIFTEWSKSKTYEEVVSILTKDKDIKYIITPSFETAEGAILAVEKLNLSKSTKVICMDFTLKVAKLLEEGRLEGTVSQELIKQGEAIANSIIMDNKLKDKNYNEKRQKLFNSAYITKQNLDSYKDQKNIYKW